MRTDREQSDENREEAGLEEALKLWVEIRQVDQKKRLGAVGGRNRPATRITPTGKASSFGLLSVAGCCRYFMLRDRRVALASICAKASNPAITRLG